MLELVDDDGIDHGVVPKRALCKAEGRWGRHGGVVAKAAVATEMNPLGSHVGHNGGSSHAQLGLKVWPPPEGETVVRL